MRRIFVIFCFGLFCSCVGRSEKTLSKPDFQIVNYNVCDTIFMPENVGVYSYTVLDSVVAVQTQDDINFVKLVDRKAGTLLKEYFNKGRASGEFVSVNWIPTRSASVGVYDIMNGAIYTYGIGAGGELNKRYSSTLPKSEGATKPYTQIIPISETVFLMKGVDKGHVGIDVFDISKGEVVGVVSSGIAKDESIDPLYYDFNIAYAEGVLYLFYRYADRIEVYDFKDNKATLNRVYGHSSVMPNTDNQEPIEYYTYATTDGEFFYASRLGVPYDECEKSQIEIYPIGNGVAKKIDIEGVVEFFDVDKGRVFLLNQSEDRDVIFTVET